MFEIILEYIVLTLVQYPGAFIRWILFRKKSYDEYLKQDLYWNAFPIVLIIIIIVSVYYF
jgi:hypothetical protein